MSRTTSHHRPRGFPILGLCGVLLLAAGVAAVAQVSTCVNCNCYFSTDCKCPSPQVCSYSTGCKVWLNNGKAVDGRCISPATSAAIAAGETSLAAQALDFWLQAFEQAAWRGGEPDAALIAKAATIPLTPEQHASIRSAALDTQARLFGLTGDSAGRPGGFVMPAVGALCSPTEKGSTPVAANGSLQKVTPDGAGVARIVREAMVAELREPFRSNFEQVMDRIPKEFPGFAIRGSCEPPAASAQRFPYQSGHDCLKQETLAIVHALVGGGGEQGAAHDGVSLRK